MVSEKLYRNALKIDIYAAGAYGQLLASGSGLAHSRKTERKMILGLRQVDTTIYHVTKGYAISAIVTELKMKLTFIRLSKFFFDKRYVLL